MKAKRHIWDCVPQAPKKVQVNFTDDFLDELRKKLPSNRRKTIREINKSEIANLSGEKANYARWYDWFKYKKVNFPLWAALALAELAGISKERMESKINFYKQKFTPNRVGVKNPILPVRINKELVRFAGHLYFDGSLPKDGHGTEYSQKNKKQREKILKLVKDCFGNVKHTESKDSKEIPRLKFPRIIGEICKQVLSIESFNTYDSSVPSFIKNDKEYALPFLNSAIIDEGGVMDSVIQVQLTNKCLVSDLKEICDLLDYRCSGVKKIEENPPRADRYYFYIRSIEKMREDFKENNLDFSFKGDKVSSIMRYKKFEKGENTKKEAERRRKNIILTLKKEAPLNSTEIAEKIKVRPKSVRRHLLYLVRKNKIKRERRGKFYYYYL